MFSGLVFSSSRGSSQTCDPLTVVSNKSKKPPNMSTPINSMLSVFPCTFYSGTYLHLCDVDRLVDEYPGGSLVAGRDGDGALVGDVARGVGVKFAYVQAH